MELIGTKDDKKVWLHNYESTDELSLLFEGRTFICLLWNNKNDVTHPGLVKELLKLKCKYFLAGGHNTHEWELLADLASTELFPNNTDSEHIMTTSHDNEPLKEVLWFALNCTHFEPNDFKEILILQIGDKYSKESCVQVLNEASTPP